MIRVWAITYAPSRLTELIQLEQAMLAYARKHGLHSSDWVNELKLWILREGNFEKPPPRARPPEDVRAVSRERGDAAEERARARQKQLEEWKREKDESGAVSEGREEFRRRMRRTATA